MIRKESANRIVISVDRLLKPIGFSRRNKTWNRSSKPLIKVLDIQTSKSGKMFTINCGVFSECVYQLVWDKVKPTPTFIQEVDCAVRTRANALLPGKRDRWFDYDDEQAAAEAQLLIQDVAIPFLESINNYEQMAEWQRKLDGTTPLGGYALPQIYLAAIEYCGGAKKTALDRLDELVQKNHWKDFVERVRDQLLRGHGDC